MSSRGPDALVTREVDLLVSKLLGELNVPYGSLGTRVIAQLTDLKKILSTDYMEVPAMPSKPLLKELSRIVERTIAKEENTVHAVLDRDDVLQLRSVCREVLVAPHVQDYAVKLIMATQPDQKEAHDFARRYIRYGSSPRGAQALVECGRVLALLRGRFHLSIDDIRELAPSVLRHRIILNFDAHADGKSPDSILTAIISGVTVHASTA